MNKKRAMIMAAAGAALLWLLLGLALWARRGADEAATARYNAHAERLQTQEHPRGGLGGATPTPGCSAGEGYQAAVEACGLAPDQAARDQLQAFVERLGPGLGAPHGAAPPKTPPNPGGLPKACEALGLTHDPNDPAQPWLTEAVCAELARCAKPLERVLEATRCEDARGPLGLYDPWLLDPKSAPDNPIYRPLLGFLYASRLLSARLWVWSKTGQRERALAELPQALRYTHDLGTGGSLLGLMLGIAGAEAPSRWLRAEIARDGLSEQEARALLRDLGTLPSREGQRADAVTGEFLHFMPLFLDDGEGALKKPPTTLDLNHQDGNWWDRMMLRRGLAEVSPLWEGILEVQGEPLQARLVAYEGIKQALQQSHNPLVQVIGVEYSRYDVKVAVADARLELLRLALADAALRKGSPGAKPRSVAELRALWPAPQGHGEEWEYTLEDGEQGRRLCAKLTFTHPKAALPDQEDRPCVALP
jgi:tetratricopeptide (TPR) repeat protein